MRKRTAWLLSTGLLVLAGIIAFFAYSDGRLKMKVSTAEAQSRIDAALAKRTETDQGKKVRVDSAVVQFLDDKMHVRAEVSGETKGRKVKTTIHTSGLPEYRSGGFYYKPSSIEFKNLMVEKTESKPGIFDKTKKALAEKKKGVKEKLDEFAAKHGWDTQLDAFRTDLQTWISGQAEAVAITALTNYPLFTPKNDRNGFLIKAGLEKVEVVGDELVITLSLVQFGYTILIAVFVVLLVIGLIAAMFMFPEFFIVVGTLGALGS